MWHHFAHSYIIDWRVFRDSNGSGCSFCVCKECERKTNLPHHLLILSKNFFLLHAKWCHTPPSKPDQRTLKTQVLTTLLWKGFTQAFAVLSYIQIMRDWSQHINSFEDDWMVEVMVEVMGGGGGWLINVMPKLRWKFYNSASTWSNGPSHNCSFFIWATDLRNDDMKTRKNDTPRKWKKHKTGFYQFSGSLLMELFSISEKNIVFLIIFGK